MAREAPATTDAQQAAARIELALTSLTRRAQLERIHRELSRTAGVALNRQEYALLAVVDELEPVSVSHLAAAFDVDASTLSRLAQRLRERELLGRERAEADARTLELRISERGSHALQAMRTARRQRLSEALAAWPDEDIASFASLLQRFVEGLQGPGAG